MADNILNGLAIPFSGNVELTVDGVNLTLMDEQSQVEVVIKESLTSPQLFTSVTVQDVMHTDPVKNYDEYKGKVLRISAFNPNIIDALGNPVLLVADQRIYRMDSRKPLNYNVEKYHLFTCDDTVLADQTTRISKFYKSVTPSDIIADALKTVGARATNIEPTLPVKDYSANNLHPFQVATEQADQSLAVQNEDPSLLHFMTYEAGGTHHFRSLKMMGQQAPIVTFFYNAKGFAGNQIMVPSNIMTYNFPCDFDLLSDIMNGVGMQQEHGSAVAIDPFKAINSLQGAKDLISGIGRGPLSSVFTNQLSKDHSSPTSYEKYALRQARMSLIKPDKIVLNMMVPFNPLLNAGKVITIRLFPQMEHTNTDIEDFGSGDYLIVNLTHNIKTGGYGTTTLDCVAKTVSDGIVGF